MVTYYKYPRILHLPTSPGVQDDDKVHKNFDFFKGKKVVVTEKMDGENTSLYRNHIHARSINSRHHASRDVVKGMWGEIHYEIPKGWRIVGENLYAQHSISYTDLTSYFYAFSIWNENNVCLGWDETLEILDLLEINPVIGIYNGEFDLPGIMESYNDWKSLREDDGFEVEGFVVRLYNAFHFKDFSQSIAKYVRKGHVQTNKHWMHQEVIPNKLKKNKKTGEKNGESKESKYSS